MNDLIAEKAAAETGSTDQQIAAQLGDTLDPTKYNDTKVRVKVDGEEKDLTLADVVASYQKGEAASRRLTEATNQAKMIIADATKAAEELKNAAALQNTAPGETANADDKKTAIKAKYVALSEAQFTGDTNKAADIQMEIDEMRGTSQGTAQTFDTSKIVEELTPRIKQQVTLESAYEDFATDYSEIVSNPALNGMAVSEFQRLVAGGKDVRTAFKESGEYVRTEVKKIAGTYGMTEANQQSTAANDKLARKEKASAETAITAASGVKTATTEVKPQSRQDVLDEMTRARGKGGQIP